MRRLSVKLLSLLTALALALSMSALALAEEGFRDLVIHRPKNNTVCYRGESIPVSVETETLTADYLNQFTCALYPAKGGKAVWKKVSAYGEEVIDFQTTLKSKSLAPGVYQFRADLEAHYNSEDNILNHHYTETAKVTVKELKAPAKLKAAAGKGRVTVTYKKAAGGKKYEIHRSAQKKSGYKKIAVTSKTKYVDKKVKKGKRYYYKVRTLRGKLASKYTAPVRSGKVK